MNGSGKAELKMLYLPLLVGIIARPIMDSSYMVEAYLS
jgi:hypothetical protein